MGQPSSDAFVKFLRAHAAAIHWEVHTANPPLRGLHRQAHKLLKKVGLTHDESLFLGEEATRTKTPLERGPR